MFKTSLGRVLVASGLVAVTSFMASTAAFAAPKTIGNAGYINLSGNVPSTLTLSLSELQEDLTSVLTSEGTLDGFRIANVTYGTNAKGLTVKAVAVDALTLVSDGSNPVPIPFKLAFSTRPYTGNATEATLIDNTDPVTATTTGLHIQAAVDHIPAGRLPVLYPGTFRASFYPTFRS